MRKVFFTSILFFLIVTFATATTSAYLIKGLEGEIETQEVKIDGKSYVLLVDACNANGLQWQWDSISRKISIQREEQKIVLLIGSRYYSAGEKVKKLSAPVRIESGNVYIPLRFAKYTIRRLFDSAEKFPSAKVSRIEPSRTKEPLVKRYRIKKVVIDPGHGGKDPGAIGKTGLKEKDIVLDVSRRIKKELEKNGIDVIMTRNSDKFIPLGQRTEIANENAADIFVSIHANANRARWLRGFEVYHLSEATDDNARALATAENSVLKYEEGSFVKHTKNLDAIIWDLKFTENREESIELAGFICHEVSERLKLTRNKIRSARFYVLKGTEMPAVLVELSYLSNRLDERNLKKSYYRQKLAKGIAAGIINYKCEYERTNGFSR